MAIKINTNLSAMVVQKNLANATKSLDKALEKMTTGAKINKSKDNAANFSILKDIETKISSLNVASENVSMGTDMLSTLEDNLNLLSIHLQRIRDLTEQAANGTYSTSSRAAIESEITARLDEITRIQGNTEYNGISLLKDAGAERILQVGIRNDENSRITLLANLTSKIELDAIVASNCSSAATAATALDSIDTILSAVSTRITNVGAMQNRLESASESIEVQYQNLTSSLSTIKDADIATESSNFIKAQILQQAASTLLATANQTPSIALGLI